MVFSAETNNFINNYVKALKENNAVVFAGAGLSVDVGYFDWKKLLTPIAERLKLDIEEEYDLTALAQYFVDQEGGRGELNQILIDQYNKTDVKLSEKHRILARLPIQIYWTTNFDNLLEQALVGVGKTPDVKKSQENLFINLSKRDAIVYKMHGDTDQVSETILTKHDYEDYNKFRELFSNAFKSDFISRTFLFIGFSFTDPNLDYLVSRIRSIVGRNKKPDYYFIKKDTDPKKQHRQEIRTHSLKLYGLHPVWVDNYSEIEEILQEIETRYLRNSILISGSADTYAPYSREDAEEFLHYISLSCSKEGYKIVSGFGLGVGSAVINGVLENMQDKRNQNLDNYIIMRPFPQFPTGGKDLIQLWKEYREKFIPLAGIAVFVFGNKRNNEGELIIADGVEKEFEIAYKKGLKVIPIGATGGMAEELWKRVIADFDKYYGEYPTIKPFIESLGNKSITLHKHIGTVINIINQLNHK